MATTTKKKTETPKEEKVIATVIGGRLNVRQDRSTEHPPVRVLEDGEQIEVFQVGKLWCKIKDGYVMRKYLDF